MNRKPLFDYLRRLIGRPFRQSEVDRIDDALDAALGARPEVQSGHRIGPEGVELIKSFEGCARVRNDDLVEAYPDPGTGGAPWTIGWGATGAGIGPATVWTRERCDARLEEDLERYAAEVIEALDGAPTSQAQFDALVSFHYNTGAIARATLTRRHRAGDHAGAAGEFARWKHAGGRVLRGLVRRRAAEAALYRSG
ncbi:lysozyme [Qipengyuania sp. MTN3-11]|uniref:lysozyme n=1 Tax=Qipengyuania sp. MTN3-11 TaxID=3056557 RepID=UPI0036F21307